MKSPFESAKRRSTEAENVRVEVTLANGIAGWGEASPAAYVTGETPQTVTAAIGKAADALAGHDLRRVSRWGGALQECLPSEPTARSAVEMALLDGLTQSWGIPLWIYFGGAVTEVRTDLTIPISSVAESGELARAAAGLGYRSLKIKVGGPDRDEDLRRVAAISRAAPAAAIRLDANQAFTAIEALVFLRECERLQVPVEMLEQPVPRDDWEGLIEVTRSSRVPVIADETVVDAGAALRVASERAAHGINIKVAKAGLLGALQIIAIARAAGLQLMIGCMLESLLGVAGGLHLACGTGAFTFVDLDSHALIGLRPAGQPFVQEKDCLRVSVNGPGIGWTPAIG